MALVTWAGTVQPVIRLYAGSRVLLIDEYLGRNVNGSFVRTFESSNSGAKFFGVPRSDSEPLMIEPYDDAVSVLAQLRGHSELHEVGALVRYYESIRIYRDWSFGRQAALRTPQRADEKNDYLADDASNLGLILSRFRNDSKAKKRLLAELQSFMDGVVDFNVLVEGGTVQLVLEEFDRTIPATRLSDGTLRYLALLAILCDPSPPRLVCIEEPELGLHPDVLPNIARLMVEASERTQLIVTTHSDVIVDALTDYPDAIVVCERAEDGSRMQRLDPEKLKPWLESYRLGQLWSKGEIGGNRW
ncbi:MAG TPA: AAA family ATPase [Tahibacter sp.]|nr:AAA family ATPase [Tahibacter sp.]